MAIRHLLLRITPRLGRGWIIAALLLAAILGVGIYVRWAGPAPPIALLALGPEGEFRDTVRLPADWADTATHTPDAVARFPLILGARNLGRRAVRPERLAFSLPVRYRVTGPGGEELPARMAGGSPLVTYSIEPGFRALEPDRLPDLLPSLDTLWLEVVIPAYYCVAVGDSLPEFVPAQRPALRHLADVRVFYSFEGGDLKERRTGTLVVGLDTTALVTDPAPELPTFPMRIDPRAAAPPLDSLVEVGTRTSRCGEPDSPMELVSTVYATPSGGRLITLEYGGRVRKRLYDLDGDGVIERESWAPDGETFTATRRARLPVPEFLLPVAPDTAAPDSLADTLAVDSGGGPPRQGGASGAGGARARDTGASAAPAPSNLIEPEIRPVQPLRRPTPDTAPPDTVPADTGGGR